MRYDIIKYCGKYHCRITIREQVLGVMEPSLISQSIRKSHSETISGLLINLVGNFLGERREVEEKLNGTRNKN